MENNHALHTSVVDCGSFMHLPKPSPVGKTNLSPFTRNLICSRRHRRHGWVADCSVLSKTVSTMIVEKELSVRKFKRLNRRKLKKLVKKYNYCLRPNLPLSFGTSLNSVLDRNWYKRIGDSQLWRLREVK